MVRKLPSPKKAPRPRTAEDYVVSVASKAIQKGRFYGTLTLVRKTDGRILFPFLGAPDIGPFVTFVEARKAAEEWASRLIAADLLNPEK